MQERVNAHKLCPHYLPETFNVRDEQVGVRWVTMATRHLNRSGAISGG